MMLWWLAQNALGAAALSLVVAGVVRWRRPNPAAVHALWLLVVFKLLAPPLQMWAWPLEPDAASPVAAVESITPEALKLTAPATPIDASPMPAASEPPALSVWDKTRLQMMAWAGSLMTFGNLAVLLVSIWLVGSLVLIQQQVAWVWRTVRRIRPGTPAPDWLIRLTKETAETLGVREPRLHVSTEFDSPQVWGGWRARLLIPEGLLERLDETGWRAVLIHELAHLKRRDHWVGWLELAAACVWWWNPVFWYARRRLRESAELACDAWVVRTLPERRRTYAESLITVIDTISTRKAPVAVIGMAAIGRRMLERRLTMILKESVPHRMSRSALAAVMLATLVVLPGWSQPQTTTQPPVEPDPKVLEALQTPVSIRFHDQHLSAITDYLMEYFAVNIAVDPRVVKPDPENSIHFARGVPLAVLRMRQNDSGIDEAEMVFAPPPSAGVPIPAPPIRWYCQGDEINGYTIGSIDLNKHTVSVLTSDGKKLVVEQLDAFRQTNLEEAEDKYATNGMVDLIELTNVPLEEALKALTKPLGLTYRAERKVVWISTPEMLNATPSELPSQEKADAAMVAKLAEPVTIDFEDQHVSEILSYISEYFHVNIVLDAREVRPPQRPRTSGSAQEESNDERLYRTDGMVAHLRLKDAPLDQTLAILTRSLDLTYVVEGDVVFVTAPETAATFAMAPLPANAPQALTEPVSFDWERASLADILAETVKGRDLNVKFDELSQSEEIVTYIKLNDVPLWQALNWIVVPQGLACTVKDGTVWIGTPERARNVG